MKSTIDWQSGCFQNGNNHRKDLMKFTKSMKTEAWLLDDDILLRGYIKRKWFRHIFIPYNKGCGFSYQYVSRKDIGKELFYDELHIVYAGLGHLERVYKEEIVNEK